MGDFLRLYGIPVPIAAGGARPENERIGSTQRRAVSASPLEHYRADKRAWSLDTVLMKPLVALALRDLLRGYVDSWSFDSTLYSSRGFAATAGGGTALSATQVKHGVKSLAIPNGGSLSLGIDWRDPSAKSWTAVHWHYYSAAWHHWIQDSSGGKWLDGSPSVATARWATSYLSLDWDYGNSVTEYVDDVLVLPFALSALDSPDIIASNLWQVHSARAAAPAPGLVADGDLIEAGTEKLTVRAELRDMAVEQGYVGGSFYNNLHALSFRLAEA